MTLALFCTPEYINKRNATLMKLGTNDVNMTTSWRYWFPRYFVFWLFSLKETETLLNRWCEIKINFTCDHRKSYLQILLSKNTREINFHLKPRFNKYPVYFMIIEVLNAIHVIVTPFYFSLFLLSFYLYGNALINNLFNFKGLYLKNAITLHKYER